LKIALAHDWLNQLGGAEYVLEEMVDLYPNAPIYTTIYGPELMPAAFHSWDIRPTWLNRAPAILRHHQPYLPLYPSAVASMDLGGYDVILSNKSGFIHGLPHAPQQLHICYCLAPTRYVWDFESYAAREGFGHWLGVAARPLIKRLRRWDFEAAQAPATNLATAPARTPNRLEQGVHYFIAISKDIQKRIRKYYQRDSTIIYPPVNTDRFQPVDGQPRGDYYLVVARLIPYKRIDLAVAAFTRLGKRLIVVGAGRDRAQLESMAGPTIEFKGRLPQQHVVELVANCRAFLFPGFEDFGIAPVEAQAAGRPVIAFARGGALDTVLDAKTGLLFREQSVEALVETVEQFERMSFDPAAARENALRFSRERFRQELKMFVEQKWWEFSS
jgi:glycosyltransferase involved in cell wall biosynthesis